LDYRRLTPILIIVFVNFLSATLVLPALQLFASSRFDAPAPLITLIGTSYFIAQFLAGPILGRWSDWRGRVPVLLISLLGTTLSFLWLPLANSLWMLFAARILDGLTGGNIIVAQAYITDITPREQRTRALGLVFAAFGLGYIVGPALGGILAQFGETVPFYAGALLSLLTVVLCALTVRESLPADARLERRLTDRKLRPQDVLGNRYLLLVMALAFFAQFSLSFLQQTFSLYGEQVIFVGQSYESVLLGVGILLTAIGIGQFVTQLVLIQPLIRRWGEPTLVMIGTVLRGFGMVSVVFFDSPWLIGGVSLLAFAIGSGLMMPCLQSLSTTAVADDLRGGVLGVYHSATSLGVIIGSALSGVLFEAAPWLPYIVGGVILLLLFMPARVLTHMSRPPTAPAQPAEAVW
jgi:MFS transporter, DHA1 family, tetracycline resistance protein